MASSSASWRSGCAEPSGHPLGDLDLLGRLGLTRVGFHALNRHATYAIAHYLA